MRILPEFNYISPLIAQIKYFPEFVLQASGEDLGEKVHAVF